MKLKHRSLLMGICLALSLLGANLPAYARATTAFTSFHVRPDGSSNNPYGCLTENWGAVVNQCPYEVSLMFDLTIDLGTNYSHTVSIQNFVNGTGTTGATCWMWSYDGNGHGWPGSTATFNSRGIQTLMFYAARAGTSISLICNVPSGEGIGAVTWVP